MKKQNWKMIKDGELKKDVFVKRAKIISLVRAYFEKNGFVETETPLIVKHPGTEPYLNLFQTHFEFPDKKETAYLITSPEIQMKKLLVAGFEKVFQITRSYRNGEAGGNKHNPEFTMLEWYRSPGGYSEIMQDSQEMIQFVVQNLFAKQSFVYQDKEINLEGSWEKKKVNELFLEVCDLDLNQHKTLSDFKNAAEKMGYKITDTFSWDDIFYQIFLDKIEPQLPQDRPLFVYNYPATQAALCKPCSDDDFWAERFELYLGGVELCNAFTELAQPEKVAENFQADLDLRKKLGKTTYEYDQDFIDALQEGLPECGGNALGIDRLVMILLNQENIENVILFPYRDL